MSQPIKEKFDSIARLYDVQKRYLVPCFEDFYGITASLAECKWFE